MTGFESFTARALELDGTREGARFLIRRAESSDLPALVALLRDDALGSRREQAGGEDFGAYERAFELIAADPNQLLIAVETVDRARSNGTPLDRTAPDPTTPNLGAGQGEVVGTLQLSLIPGLSRSGATRLQIEAVRIAPDLQGSGLGRAVFDWAHDCGRAAGASVAQLTTDKSRTGAHRFYDRLGYTASHEGLKREL